MTANEVVPDTGDSPPRRGRRKRWIVLIAIFGSLLWAWMSLFQESSVAVVRLPDGKTVNIHKITLGKVHTYSKPASGLTSAEIWANKWLARVGRGIAYSYRYGNEQHTGSLAIGLWYSFDSAASESEATPHSMIMTDERGWRTANALSHALIQFSPPPVSTGGALVPQFVSMAMPSTSGSIKIELINSKGVNLGSTQIPYTVPECPIQEWSPQSLPVTETEGNMSVTLVDVTAVRSKPEEPKSSYGDILGVNPEYRVTIDGIASEDWIPLLTRIPLFFYAAGARPVVASIESPLGATAPLDRCTVSPFESTWRLHLALISRDPSQATSAQVVDLTDISFDGGNAAPTQSEALPTNGEAVVTLMGAGRAGTRFFESSGEAFFPIPQPIPLGLLTNGELEGTFQSSLAVNQISAGFAPQSGANRGLPQYPLLVSLKLTVSRPHLVISVTDAGGRFPYVIVKDQDGQVLEGELYNVQGALVWLAKFPYNEIDRVDATVLLQTPRYFSFDVVPPTVSPHDPSDPSLSK